MKAFLQLSDIGRAALISVFYAVLTGLFFLLIVRRIRLCRPLACIPPLPLFLLIGLDLICLAEGNNALHNGDLPTLAGHWAGSLPWAAHAFLLIASGLYCARGLRREKRVADREITPDSIRESFDNMPSGICFSDANGIPLLTNRRMYDLADSLSGHRLRNAEELWQELTEFDARNGIECVRGGDSPVFRLSDGSVWRFARARLTIGAERFSQTTATDITRLHTLSEDLAKGNAALHEQQKRLKTLLAQIVHLKREEEILASKVKLHDELGRCVLASRRVLLQESPGEAIEPVLALWRETVEKLEVSLGNMDQTEDDPLRQLTDAAAFLGCAIEFEGGLPENRDIAYLLLSAVREAVTNAVRHAGADRVMVRLMEKGDVLAVEIADNGTKCPDTIVESGGLQNMRRRVERTGGAMWITCQGGVRLHLLLRPAGKEE